MPLFSVDWNTSKPIRKKWWQVADDDYDGSAAAAAADVSEFLVKPYDSQCFFFCQGGQCCFCCLFCCTRLHMQYRSGGVCLLIVHHTNTNTPLHRSTFCSVLCPTANLATCTSAQVGVSQQDKPIREGKLSPRAVHWLQHQRVLLPLLMLDCYCHRPVLWCNCPFLLVTFCSLLNVLRFHFLSFMI